MSFIEPPVKRRRVEHGHIPEPSIVTVKREASPSPPPSWDLCTSGVKFVGFPVACHKSRPGWRESRKDFINEEVSKLKLLGLQVTKELVREDGLALDWVSPVPVSRHSLRPPSPTVESSREDRVSRSPMPSVASPLDPLGHALCSQTSMSFRVPEASSPSMQSANLNNNETTPHASHASTEHEPSDSPEFPVVGAALLKKRPNICDDSNTRPTPNEPFPSQHRKLLPVDLRVTPDFSKSGEMLKDWKMRRKAWIANEIEKVEGYTGGRSRGFKYDGDDVIIFLQKHHPDSERNVRQGMISHKRPPASMRRTQPSNITGNGNLVPPTNLPSIPIRPPAEGIERTSATGNNDADNPYTMHGKGAVIHDANPESTRRDTSGAASNTDDTQARGLHFLEQYLQTFDRDRDSLRVAYTEKATFSLRAEEGYLMNRSSPPMSRFNEVVAAGPLSIVENLRQLSCHLHHSPSCEVVYSIAALDEMSPGGLLVNCEGLLVHPRRTSEKPEWSFSRTFVLKQNVEEGSSLWPLKIVAERLTIAKT